METQRNTKGFYIYGFIPVNYDVEQAHKLENIEVHTIAFNKVTAIVSEKTVVDYQQLGTKTLATLLIDHQRTIESVMNMGFPTIIPMRFGTFANNNTEVIDLLEKGHDLLIETFEKTINLIEVDVVAMWADFSIILAEIAANPKVVELKNKIENSATTINDTEKIAVGYLVSKLLDGKKAEYSELIEETLKQYCLSTKKHEVMNDQMVSNTAFLLNKNQQESFENALDQLDETLKGKINFKLVGPLPYYSFYTIEVKDLHFDEIDLARKELDLGNLTTEKKIKQAYLDKVKLFHPDTNAGIDTSTIFDRINKAYHTMTDYVNAVKPGSRDEQFSLPTEAVSKNSFILKIKE